MGYRPPDEPTLPRADTHGRKHSLVWVALGWGGLEATGGVLPPGVGGGSAQGKSPIPNDFFWQHLAPGVKIAEAPKEVYALAVQAYAQRRAKGLGVLRLLQQEETTYAKLVMTEQIRPITDLICKWWMLRSLCPPPSCTLHPPAQTKPLQ